MENQLDSVTEKPTCFLRLQGLACDWSKHNKHSRNIFSVHGFLRLSVINSVLHSNTSCTEFDTDFRLSLYAAATVTSRFIANQSTVVLQYLFVTQTPLLTQQTAWHTATTLDSFHSHLKLSTNCLTYCF